jgi:hypothetical protein
MAGVVAEAQCRAQSAGLPLWVTCLLFRAAAPSQALLLSDAAGFSSWEIFRYHLVLRLHTLSSRTLRHLIITLLLLAANHTRRLPIYAPCTTQGPAVIFPDFSPAGRCRVPSRDSSRSPCRERVCKSESSAQRPVNKEISMSGRLQIRSECL